MANAKKSAPASASAKKPVKKSAATKQPATDPVNDIITMAIDLIEGGLADSYLVTVSDAITKRSNEQNSRTPAAETGATKKEGKSIPTPTRAAEFVPEVGKSYIVRKLKVIDGATVKFLRFRKDDDSKAVVEMLTEKPGNPKGKTIVVPVKSLEKKPARKPKSK